MRSHGPHTPLAGITAAFAAGIVMQECGVPLALAAVAIAAAVLLFFLSRRTASLLCLGMGAAMLMAGLEEDDSPARALAGISRTCQIDVLDVKEGEGALLLTGDIICAGPSADSLQQTVPVRTLLILPSFSPSAGRGDRIIAAMTPEIPSFVGHVPLETDYPAILRRKGVRLTSVIRPEDVLSVEKSPALRPRIAALRSEAEALIMTSTLGVPAKEFLVTTLTGDASFLTSERREDFTRAGLAHILALSGLHVGIIAGLLMALLYPLGILRHGRNIARAVTILAIWVFAFMTGLSASVVRAAVMITIVLAAPILRRGSNSLNSLLAAAMIIMVFNPSAVLTISFQLSFAAVAGIIVFSEYLNPVDRSRRLLHTVCSFMAASVAAMLATGLISMFHFHRFPLLFLLGNLAVCPFLPVLIGGGMVMVVMRAAGFEGGFLGRLLDHAYWLVDSATSLAAGTEAEITGIIVPPAALAAGLGAVALLAVWLRKRRPAWLAACGVAMAGALAMIFLTTPPSQPEVFIAPSTYRTDILIRHGDRVVLSTTAPAPEHPAIEASSRVRYADYLLDRGVRELSVSDSCVSPAAVLRSGILSVRGVNYAIISHVRPQCLAGAHCLVICRGFTGSLSDLLKESNAPCVLLSADLHPRRHDRYLAECGSLGLTAVSLRDKPLGNLFNFNPFQCASK